MKLFLLIARTNILSARMYVHTLIFMYLKILNMSMNVYQLPLGQLNCGEYRSRTDDLLNANQAL